MHCGSNALIVSCYNLWKGLMSTRKESMNLSYNRKIIELELRLQQQQLTSWYFSTSAVTGPSSVIKSSIVKLRGRWLTEKHFLHCEVSSLTWLHVISEKRLLSEQCIFTMECLFSCKTPCWLRGNILRNAGWAKVDILHHRWLTAAFWVRRVMDGAKESSRKIDI